MRRRGLEKIPRLQTLRYGFVKLEMIHQAGGSWGGIVGRRFGAICKFKGKFKDARLKKKQAAATNSKTRAQATAKEPAGRRRYQSQQQGWMTPILSPGSAAVAL